MCVCVCAFSTIFCFVFECYRFLLHVFLSFFFSLELAISRHFPLRFDVIFNDRNSLPSYYLFFAGEPQEECVRCGKMYILSGDLNKGACGKCLGIIPSRDQLKSTPFRSSGESSGTEEEDEEESSNDIP